MRVRSTVRSGLAAGAVLVLAGVSACGSMAETSGSSTAAATPAGSSAVTSGAAASESAQSAPSAPASSVGGAETCENPNVAADGTWSFTDDIGRTVTLDEAPTKVAGLTDVLFSLMNYGLEPVASFGYSSMDDDVRFADLDTSGVVQVGATYGEINREELLETEPDVIVTHLYATDAEGTLPKDEVAYGFADKAQQDEIDKIAPVITIGMGGTAVDVIQRTLDLAAALGVCTDSDEIAAAKADFDAASAKLTSSGTGGPQVEVLYADADGIYVAKPADDPNLRMYSDFGVDIVDPGGDGYYWEILSWENASKITGDLLLVSERGGYQEKELMEQPTFASVPAAKAGQIEPWVFAGMDYPSQAEYMEQLAGFLDAAKTLG
ncbi:ABC transporter substrate-binding protein [Nakamurella sp. YIM 132087]|uniref:ABC transporter substrate-binding protein n=1 Tax=Nakamurella alba TaxID=2665158 RepID=A0A7K1FNA7_9ACTN|nr:ABC transporter substrate-binding protein [Nakamurella alba]MTD14713.1 ABC transporter substrate-binding protein [Nakamurella alba]